MTDADEPVTDGAVVQGSVATDGPGAGAGASDDALLSVRGLEKHYPVRSGLLRRVTGHVRAVDGISFDISEGETVGLVGESGCGKSTATTTLLQLEEPTAGSINFDGEDVTEYDRAEQKRFRRRAQMVFQDPNSAFDPQMTVGESIAEPLEIHGLHDEGRKREIVDEILELVDMSAADASRHPHEFSGGQKQRIALARALVLNPDLLVADEPVSALDASVQAEILTLLSDLQEQLGLSMLLITHDLGVVREVCDRVGVMYLGEIVEKGSTEELFRDPQHPYTAALLASIPTPNPRERGAAVELTGDVPSPEDPPSGCSFHPRCPRVIPPDDYEFEDGSFRSVLDVRLAAEADEVDTDRLDTAAAVREEFDVPDELSDAGAEDVVAAAADDVAAGDVARAAERLGETFVSVCEREEPTLQPTDSGRPAACLLHEERVDAHPPGVDD
jgi:peptide/nickel transport system ATP-binding protein